MSTGWNSVSLDSLGVLRARGADVVSFLQGQLSNDVARLGPERSLLAGYHNPQGRVIALLRLVQLAPDDLLAILPRELIGVVVQRLGKFVLRAKVKLADDSAAWTVTGLMGCAPPPIAAGEPQVYAATSEAFVAQMLNLDALGAIAFDKGCYTGQEIIARAHYRGKVKRRMQRFVSRVAYHPAPGDSGQLADGRAFKVVLA